MEKKMNARKKAQRAARLRKQRNRRIALTLCLMFVVAFASIGGTIAWLTANGGTVTNTFTAGDIDVTLAETTGTEYDIIPGVDITKDPKVTVPKNDNTVDAYVFVKVVEANWPTAKEIDGETLKVNYEIADGWELVEGTTDVYSRVVLADDTDREFDVIKNNTITVSETLNKTECNAISTKPTLTITAYAIQKDATGTAAEAWAKIDD